MKLISCYIENYGAISEREIIFGDGITEFCEANGYGKTTIASFIKAMFYGLDGYKSNTKEFGDRKRFYPFSGGQFGGNLTFEFNGDTYKVERFFGEKSETQDNLVVFKGGEQYYGFDGKIGESVFGLDKEAFERTLFIDATDIKISSTASIGKKLEGILGGEGDENFDLAAERLKTAAGMYKKSRKANDYISIEKHTNDTLRAEIENVSAIKGSLEPKYSALSELKKDGGAIAEELKSASTLNETLQAWETLDRLTEKANGLKHELSFKRAEYPSGVPDEKDLIRAERALTEITALTAMSDKESEDVNSRKLDYLSEKFSIGVPGADEMSEIEQLIREYQSADEEYLSVPEYIESETKHEPYKNDKFKPVAIVGGAIAFIGIVALFFSGIVGGVLIAIGLLAVAASAVISVNQKMDALKTEVQKERVLNPEKQRLKERLTEINRPIERFFIKYGYKEGRYETRFALINKDVSDFKELQAAKEIRAKRAEKRAEETERLKSEIKEIFAAKNVTTDNYSETIKSLRRYAFEISALEKRCKSAEVEAKEYAEAKNLKERPAAEKKDVEALIREQRELSAQVTALEKEIRDGEWEAERLDDLVALKAKSDEKIKEYTEKYKLLAAAAEFLEEAEKSIIEKYVGPIKRGFTKYSAALEKALGEKVGMNKNFEISFEEGGKERSEMYKSQGERSLVALCFRLALIENMYGGEKPFLVFDDPFVHLDNEHIGKVITLLNELSAGFQILYFTCHDSRSLAAKS